MTRLIASLAVAATVFSAAARADFHLFRIDQLYSTADGEVQFLVLRQTPPANGEDLWSGHALTVTHAGTTKSFTFANNLPSTSTAGRSVLVATQGYVDLRTAMPAAALPAPDYVIPNRFLPVDGATVNYAGVDFVQYAELPIDGANALFRSNVAGANRPANFAGATGAVPVVPVSSIEFHNAALDHYFQSSLAPDIDALDSGRTAGWTRTAESFKVFPTPAGAPAPLAPVCRFYIPPQHGDSHFFSAWDVECNQILALSATDPNYSGYVHETPNAFYAVLPDLVTGACPAGTRPVYRLWNQRADSNHRFTVSTAIKAQMVARGFVGEGFGPDGVAMCVS